MKNIYIPAGSTASYETLSAEQIIVEGRLNVSGELNAKKITGGGVVSAESIAADDICVGGLSTVYAVCSRLIARWNRYAPPISAPPMTPLPCCKLRGRS